MSKWRALRAAPRNYSSRAGRSRTCLEPRIRRLPRRSASARKSALYGTRTRLACSTGRSPHPLRHRAVRECFVGQASSLPLTLASWKLALRDHLWISPQARTEGVEPSAPVLEAGSSPRSTSLSISCPGRIRTCTRLVNNQPHNRCATGQSQSERPAGIEPAPPDLAGWLAGR
jgi:hypothetical protein